MRIVAGNFKGRPLSAPKDRLVRPTTDKVKEAIFSMIAQYLDDAVVIDLFAGTGNLGLEALSRGAKRCYFGDSSKTSLALIRQNVETCRAENDSVIVAGDYKKVLDKIQEKADIIFLDPPYRKGLLLSCLNEIEMGDLLAQDGIIVCEHGADEKMPEFTNHYHKLKEKKYGTIVVTIYS